ncbi:LOW QUALITY PROTEIN: uncharacterized protein srcap [Menidia menidia]
MWPWRAPPRPAPLRRAPPPPPGAAGPGPGPEDPPAPCPPLTSSQANSTAPELHYGLQTVEEGGGPGGPASPGLVVVTATGQQPLTLEYRSETGTHVDPVGNEHTGGNTDTVRQPSSSPPSVSFKVQDAPEDAREGGHLEPEDGGHLEPEDGLPDSRSASPLAEINETQPEAVMDASTDARETPTANSLGSAEAFTPVMAPAASPRRQTPESPGGVSGQPDPLGPDTDTPEPSQDLTGPLLDSGLTVSLQASGRVSDAAAVAVAAATSGAGEEASLIVHSADAQEIVVVREEAHISGDWSGMHLNQSFLLQQEDGSVCQLQPAEPKLYQQGAPEGLGAEPLEVYEFCGLVEEVAEEMPPSAGYEVDLLNALLENADQFAVKDEANAIIFSQQPMAAALQNQVGSHLVLDAGQAVEVAHSSEVCLVQVSADAFAVQHAAGAEQASVAGQQEAGGAQLLSPLVAVTGGDLQSSVAVSVHVASLNQTPAFSPQGETGGTPQMAPNAEPMASVSSDAIDPKLLLLRPGEMPVLKHPPALLLPGAGPPQTSQSEALTFTKAAPDPPDGADPPEDAAAPGNSPVAPGSEEEEEESEDMEADGEGRGPDPGPPTSNEDESEDEPDKSETASPGRSQKWISDGGIHAPPSTSSSFLGPSAGGDWAPSRREKSSPLRGPHGKFVSPASVGYGPAPSPPDHAASHRARGERHTDMAELAKHEADIEHRTQALKREGFWSTKRLTRLTEPPRPKVHWDYLCEEMQWLSADFAQERRWKRGVARKVVRMVMRHHEDLRQKEEKAKRDEHAKIRRVASSIAKEVRAFWSSVEKVVQYKQQSRLEEKRKKALDLQLDFIVGQTEKYSDLLSKSLARSRPVEAPPAPRRSPAPPAAEEDDRDFEPPCEEEDDEETIEVEEQQEGNDAESHQREIDLLREESTLPLDQLLSTLKLPPPQDSGSDGESSESSSSPEEEEQEEEEEGEDGEFTANDEDAEDEEDTIAAQEKVEGNVNHAEELDDLAKEGDMSMEELLEKYKGAYASDFEAPSASGSKASSDSEESGDEEVETEEDESDVESNSSSSESPGDSAEEEESAKEEEESEEEEEDGGGEEGMELLLKEGENSPPSSSSRPKKEISHIAATAESLQPKGYTLATTKVKTPIPFLLHGTLREYQHIGLDWLVTMYEKKLNGILADEMGLGKTIQTIALLAHLACEKGNWGPHLIIVPTSVMLNWEMELKRWCPGFKILTYFGSQKERKLKRQGWTKPNAFHVCITSYKLVLQDHQAFRRKSWRYLILDEAQNIKNFKSQRWQSLLNFNSHRRLLLTGTPLQNSLMELWSLMHFLMPHVFQSHREFKEWFSNPLTGMIEGSQEYNEGLVKRLHKVLRPFLLRRIKADVEKQMPKKYEHVVRCRLSKRQRFLYDDFMAQASTRETLASGHFMSVINILMQLRKVCNHPNLFDPRPIQSPFITQPIVFHTASLVQEALDVPPLKRCDLSIFDLVGLESRVSRYQADVFLPRHKVSRPLIQEVVESPEPPPRPRPVRMKVNRMFQPPPKGDGRPVLLMNKPTCSVPPATQTPKPPPTTAEAPPAPAPVVQQVVCSVAPTPPPRPPVATATQTAVRSTAPRPLLTVRPPGAPCMPAHPGPAPSSVLPQRVLLSPDMQARLPSGEVVSIAQLASLAGRPVSSCQGSKPVTFQLQGNKLTLSGAQSHQVTAGAPRPVQGNVMHLVSSGMQHHLISQPAQLTVQTAPAAPPDQSAAPQRLTSSPPRRGSSPGVVKIVVRQAAGKEGGAVPTLAVAPSPRVAPQGPQALHLHANANANANTAPLQIAPRTPGPATAHYTIAPPATPPQPQPPPGPVLKVVQPPPAAAPPAASCGSAHHRWPRLLIGLQTFHRSDSSQQTEGPRPPKGHAPSPEEAPPTPPAPPSTCSPSGARPQAPWLSRCLSEQRSDRLDFIIRVNDYRCAAKPAYGREVLDFLTFLPGPRPSPAPLGPPGGAWPRSGHSACLLAQWRNHGDLWVQSAALTAAIHSMEARLQLLSDVVDRFTFAIPPVEAPPISMHCCHPPPSLSQKQAAFSSELAAQVAPLARGLHRIQCNMRTQFPDLRLIQYDCGKLQTLHTLLRKLKSGGHRVLIFTQMTRMLDVLEQFLNYHGHIYLRLDGSTRVEQRQSLMERFNADRRIFCFILSTRSGGVGVNLTGADTVVFYDSDWNPTMDAQAQDRCHRIGQTRDVHIYRLISERTVEENILKKANQKRMLGDMAIEGGNFTTAFFKQALCRAEDEEDIVAASQAKAEQVAELAEFNENIPLDEGGEPEEAEELSKAEQEIAALVEQLTPIERYAMNFLEASLEDVCKEELKQAEEQVEAARKGLDQAKEEGLMLHQHSSDDDDHHFLSAPACSETAAAAPPRRGRKPRDRTPASTRTSGRLRGASPDPDPPAVAKDAPERPRGGLRGRTAPVDAKHAHASSPSPRQRPGRPPASTPSRPSGEDGEKDQRTCESSPDSGNREDAISPPSSSRSPRKRQSADGEVLRGLADDSPSAKVLRKLPGRLVTVVEGKEPRRHQRRRRASGAGGGSSDEHVAAGYEEPPGGEGKPRAGAGAGRSPGQPDATLPRSPPDMPVLRNLPVRRRLETESRMAAQRGGGASDPPLGTPLKRKRGRPPKTPPAPAEGEAGAVATAPTPGGSPHDDGVETPPPLSPKRRRGRPRKDSTPDAAEPNANSQQSARASSSPGGEAPPTAVSTETPEASGMASPLPPAPPGCSNPTDPSEEAPPASGTVPAAAVAVATSAPPADDRPPAVAVVAAVAVATPAPPGDGAELETSTTPSTEKTAEPSAPPPTKEAPPTKSTLEAPPTNSTREAPPTVSTQEAPPTNSTQEAPPTTSNVATPTVSTNEVPPTDSTHVAPPTACKEAPPTKSTNEAPPTNSTREAPPTVSTNVAPPTASTHLAPPTNATVEDPPTDSTNKAPPTTSNKAPPIKSKEAPPTKSNVVPPTDSAHVAPPITSNKAPPTNEAPPTQSNEAPPTNSTHVAPPTTSNEAPPIKSNVAPPTTSNVAPPTTSNEAPPTDSTHVAPPTACKEAPPTKSNEAPPTDSAPPPEQTPPSSQPPAGRGEPDGKCSKSDSETEAEAPGGGAKPGGGSKGGGAKKGAGPRLSRQSSQESARSSSPSSGGSSSTLTRHAHHKRTYENRHPAKRRRADAADAEGGGAEDGEEEEETAPGEEDKMAARRRRRSSGSSSSDSDSDNGGGRRRLTRSAKRRQQDAGGGAEPPGRRGNRNASNNTNVSTGGESGSDTSSVRAGRRSLDGRRPLGPAPLGPAPPEPEVLGKRCSALNAAAKLLAMKGRVDTPGHTTRRDAAAAKTPVAAGDHSQKPRAPRSNSVSPAAAIKAASRASPATAPALMASRSTRQRPGALVPPLDLEYKRCRLEDRDGKRAAAAAPARDGGSSSSDEGGVAGGNGGGGGRCSSRSSSASSQRTTNSLSRRSQRAPPPEAGGGGRGGGAAAGVGGAEGGGADRVLRSVAALAAVQARSPAASTRSSAHQQRKT